MNFFQYKSLVDEVSVGKKLPDAVYLHASALSALPEALAKLLTKVATALKIETKDWNIIKLARWDFKVSYLHYPDFDLYAYPSLAHSFTVDLEKLSVRKADYSTSANPPILHRKETLVTQDYPHRPVFEECTREGEAIGLYENPRKIGLKQQWDRLIMSKGFSLDEHGRLIELEQQPPIPTDNPLTDSIDRHLTALDRNSLSKPVSTLARFGYLDGDYSLLDYGCGKGDDLRELEAHGLDVCGWDPAHNPEGTLVSSDLVNLGFVLNVIEDREERDETLRRAWEYAEKLLVVSVMIAGEQTIASFRPYKDGVVTSRNTFQKYFSQSELRYYVENTLNEDVVVAGQGILFVFKDKDEEQRFLLEKQFVTREWKQKTAREITLRPKPKRRTKFDINSELITDFWGACLEMGRTPANDEFEFSTDIRRIFGSHRKAHDYLREEFGAELFDEARQKREEDLTVYFALSLFEKRRPQTHMPASLVRDIKAFYGSYNDAIEHAKENLFSVGNPEVIESACQSAYSHFNCGEMTEGHSYTFRKDLLDDAPVALRVYVGCAIQLFGDLETIQLIKAHIRSGKVSFMGYRDWESETPYLIERIKVRLRDQDVDFFDYVGDYSPVPLANKSIYFADMEG